MINPSPRVYRYATDVGRRGWRLGGRSERPPEPERSPGEPAGKLVWLIRLKSRPSYTVDLSVRLGSRKFTARAVARQYSEYLVQERFESFGGTTTQGGHRRRHVIQNDLQRVGVEPELAGNRLVHYYLFKLRVITNVIITYIA